MNYYFSHINYFIVRVVLYWVINNVNSKLFGWVSGIFILPILFLFLNSFSDYLHKHKKSKSCIFISLFLNYWVLGLGSIVLDLIFTDSNYFPTFDYRAFFIHILLSVLFAFLLMNFSLIKFKKYRRQGIREW